MHKLMNIQNGSVHAEKLLVELNTSTIHTTILKIIQNQSI